MYVCICNALTEEDVRGSVAAGACSTKQVKQACGWKPSCGSCVGKLSALIDSAQLSDQPLHPAESSAA